MKNEIVKRLQRSSITLKEIEFSFYIPVGKINHNSITHQQFVKNNNVRRVETEHGIIEMRNRLLTERHQHIITSIIHHAQLKELKDGRVAAYFDELDILIDQKMGNKNYSALRNIIKIIADARYYSIVEGYSRSLKIIDDHILEEKSSGKMQGIIFSKEYVAIHASDFSMDMKRIASQLSEIPYSTIPSIVKKLLINNKENAGKVYQLDDVLISLGFPSESPNSLKKIKMDLKKYKSELRDKYNIVYDDVKKTLVCVQKLKGLKYNNPMQHKLDELNVFISMKLQYEDEEYVIKSIENDTKSYNSWEVKTNKKDIILNYHLDDLLYYLEKFTSKNTTPSLFE